MDKTILHVDANCFYASVETALDPSLADKPTAVVGDSEKRHGIVLTANYIAKRSFGVKTGEPIWQAERKCPNLVKINAHMQLYAEYSRRMREILLSYSDYVEPFGCDEAWVELRGMLKGSGEETAHRIRSRIKEELGITVSVGVSFNKIFAKLGSDMKKPDAVTVITRENFKDKVWGLPVEDLLYVGPKTKLKLNKRAVYTIGDLAHCDVRLVGSWLGKNGELLHSYANGYDSSEVRAYDKPHEIKSIGNSTTCPYDLTEENEVRTVLISLADLVSYRMRKEGVQGREITISIRDSRMHWISHGHTFRRATDISREISDCAFRLFKETYGWINPIRSLGISVGRLCDKDMPIQLDLFSDEEKRSRLRTLDSISDALKNRFGADVILKARMLQNRRLSLFASGSQRHGASLRR